MRVGDCQGEASEEGADGDIPDKEAAEGICDQETGAGPVGLSREMVVRHDPSPYRNGLLGCELQRSTNWRKLVLVNSSSSSDRRFSSSVPTVTPPPPPPPPPPVTPPPAIRVFCFSDFFGSLTGCLSTLSFKRIKVLFIEIVNLSLLLLSWFGFIYC